MALVAVVTLDDWGDRRTLLRSLSVAVGSFIAAVTLCFTIKLVVVAAVWGPQEVVDVWLQLGTRVSGSGWDIAPEKSRTAKKPGVRHPDRPSPVEPNAELPLCLGQDRHLF